MSATKQQKSVADIVDENETQPEEQEDQAPATPEPQAVSGDVSEFDPIVPDLVPGGTFTIGANAFQLNSRKEPGLEIKVAPVRTKGVLAIGRVLTGSLRPTNIYSMLSPIFEANTDSEQIAAATAAVTQLVITVPHSEREFIKLLNTLVVPVDAIPDNRDVDTLVNYLQDPEPEDTVAIIAQMMLNERPRMVSLGKTLMKYAPALQRTNQPTLDQKETTG